MIEAHSNPVCTLAAARGMLFSGSLKVIKVRYERAQDKTRGIN